MIANQNHRNGTAHLSAAELGALLSEGAANEDAGDAAAHLDSCPVCQERLTTLAAGDNLWTDVQSYLGGESEPRWKPDTSGIGVSPSASDGGDSVVREMVIKLLGVPKHPEMLGRLGRYDIERVIGSGGMGIVLKAHDSELNRPIALKLLAPHLAHVGAARERFAREGRAAAAVVHEHVVAIYNVESTGPVPFLVMQYVPGRSLDARVTEDGPLGVEEILRIGIQAAAGLAAAHRQGLVHRDVKPANILLENSVERAILTDFGLARAIDDASLTQTGILAGTPHYMSPEQAMGGPIDHRSDLFSLGAVLYFMGTGHPPFRGPNALGVLHRICREPHRPAWQVNRNLPDELSDVIDRLLQKKPGRRFATAEELQEKLAALLSQVQRYGFGLGRRQFRGWRRTRRMLTWAAMGAAVSVAAIAAVAVRWWPESTEVPRGQTALAVPHDAAIERSEVDSRSAAISQSDAESSVAAIDRLDTDFGTEMRAAMVELGRVTSGSSFLQAGGDEWNRELESVNRELTKFEAKIGHSQ